VQPLADLAEPPVLGVERRLHVLRADDRRAGPRSGVVGLANQVHEAADVQRHPLAVFGASSLGLDDAADARAVDRPQPLTLLQGADQPRVQQVAVGAALHVLVEVGRDLEQQAELGVVGLEQVVEETVADQHDLEADRDRLGLERGGGGEAEQALERLDAHLAAFSARFNPSQAKGLISTFAASSSR